MIERRLKSFLAAALAAVLLAVPGAADAQTRPKGCVIESWPDYLSPGLQTHGVREKLATGSGEIVAVEFGPLTGDYGKLWLFLLVRQGCERKVLSVGSFEYLTEIARQNGDVGANERRYHVDLFDAETHQVLEYRTSPPAYEEMREIALSVLK